MGIAAVFLTAPAAAAAAGLYFLDRHHKEESQSKVSIIFLIFYQHQVFCLFFFFRHTFDVYTQYRTTHSVHVYLGFGRWITSIEDEFAGEIEERVG